MKLVKLLATVALVKLLVPAASAALAPALFTAQQVGGGEAVFQQYCASCHGSELQGGAGPSLVSQKFLGSGPATTLGSLFTFMSTQMPMGMPGKLSSSQYENVMAFILTKNGYPTGNRMLQYDVAKLSKERLRSVVR
jgi:mono/diheme cytochrome c family protein